MGREQPALLGLLLLVVTQVAANLADPPAALCNNTACIAALPGCASYRTTTEGNFGARRFYCTSCSNTTVAVKSGIVVQYFEIAGGLPKSPLAACTERLSVTGTFKKGELANCMYYYNYTNLSSLNVTFYCAECASGFTPAQYGINTSIGDFSSKIYTALETQTICDMKKWTVLLTTTSLVYMFLLLVDVILT